MLAALLLLAGNGFAAIVGFDSLRVAGGLTLAILAYDGGLKRTPLGPLAMGSCRFLNVMLGASAIGNWNSVWTALQVPIALSLGVYVVGLTWFARREAARSRTWELVGSAIVMNIGLAMLAGTILHWSYRSQLDEPLRVLFAIGVVALVINRRLLTAVLQPAPETVQVAVKTALLSLIVLDASLVYFKTGSAVWATVTLSLLIPSMLLGRWIRLT